MTQFISSFGQGAKRVGVAAVATIVMTGSAMSASCDDVPNIVSGIQNASNTYHCNGGAGAQDPAVCPLITSLPVCCEEASATVAEACLCDSSHLTAPNVDLTAAGYSVSTLCPQ